MKILGISGSLRKDSFNTRLLQETAKLLPRGVSMEIFDCGALPLYNSDLDGEEKPESVQQLKEAVAECDGLLFASPEYNYSISGVLKNAIDWASRPAYKSVLAGKPAGIISGAKGVTGGARVHLHLRDVLSATLTPVVPAPPFMVSQVQEMFDGQGNLVDETLKVRLERYANDLVDWVGLLQSRT
jgi:chromate reductase